MRTVNELNQILSDLYSDLEKLQSARNQVDLVTVSTNDLTNSVSLLLQELKNFSSKSIEINESNVFKLVQSLEFFDKKLNVLLDNTNESINQNVESFNQQVSSIIDQYLKQLSDSKKFFNDMTISNNDKIAIKFEEFEKKIEFLVKNAEDGIEKIQNIAISNIENNVKLLKDEFLVLTDQFSNQIDLNEKFINDINNSSKDLNLRMFDNLEKFSNDILKNADNIIDKIQSLAVSKIEHQDLIIAKTIDSIVNTNSNIENMVDNFNNYRILENFDTIIQKLDHQKKMSRTNKLLLIMLNVIFGFGVFFIIAIYKGFLF